ncbi:MAG: NADH-quinone oxidoreductase subunit N [Planctomycetes bacterium]|nr:NADH-quinone oxidoreductase subunit N [Planctomycetota bacterium]
MPTGLLILADMWMPSADDLAAIGPLWGFVGTLVAILVAALAVGRNWRVTGMLAALGAAVTGWMALRTVMSPPTNWAGLSPNNSPMFVADQFSAFFVLLVSVFMLLVIGMWWMGQNAGLPERLSRKGDSVEFFILLIGSAFGMSMMVSTTNLLMIVLAVEMASLPSYAITAFRKQHAKAAEAGLKYVLFGAVTSAIMIYGASLLYGHYHTLDLAEIGRTIRIEGAPTLLMGVSLFAFMVGVAFKVSAVPFHFWCPDVFEGAAIEVTTWLSVASKAAGLGLMLRIISVLTFKIASPETLNTLATAIAVMAALTCTVGNLSAFRQTNMKRLLAFSSIAHAGYMLMAVAIVWMNNGSPTEGVAHPAFSAIVGYISVYLVMNLGAFLVVAMVYWATGSESIDAMNGLMRRSPLLAVMMVVFLFSLVGLPPMGGFMAKLYLLYALWDATWYSLVIVAVFNTLISLYYYARVARAMVFSDDGQPAIRVPMVGQALATVCALVVLYTGTVGAGTLKAFSDDRAKDLYAVVKPGIAVHTAAESARPDSVNENGTLWNGQNSTTVPNNDGWHIGLAARKVDSDRNKNGE